MDREICNSRRISMGIGIHERTFRRYCHCYEVSGAEGLYDAHIEKAAHNAAPADEVSELLCLFETKYPNCKASHFFDKYKLHHGRTRCYTWVKQCLQNAGLVKKAQKLGLHRRKRERSPLAGMMEYQDGSTHD